MAETQGTPANDRPRHSIISLSLIGMGISIAALSFPVSLSSHLLAEEVQKQNPGKDGVRALAVDAGKITETGWRFATRRNENDGVITQVTQAIVAILSLLWCCCVGLTAWFADIVIEPIGRALGIAAQFSVITFAVFLAGYGLLHVGAGIGLMRGSRGARPAGKVLLLLAGFQGVFYLGATLAVWDAGSPLPGLIAACLGISLIGWCFPASRRLGR